MMATVPYRLQSNERPGALGTRVHHAFIPTRTSPNENRQSTDLPEHWSRRGTTHKTNVKRPKDERRQDDGVSRETTDKFALLHRRAAFVLFQRIDRSSPRPSTSMLLSNTLTQRHRSDAISTPLGSESHLPADQGTTAGDPEHASWGNSSDTYPQLLSRVLWKCYTRLTPQEIPDQGPVSDRERL